MCLGDLRFQPFVRARLFRPLSQIVWARFLPRNENRVGFEICPGSEAIFYIPSDSDATPLETERTTWRSQTDNRTDNTWLWMWHGDIVQRTWWSSCFNANVSFTCIEYTVPSEIMQEIRRMGIGNNVSDPRL